MINGVMMAPIAVPLCKTEFPSVRLSGGKSRWVVLRAQGQCPASKKPSASRQARSSR